MFNIRANCRNKYFILLLFCFTCTSLLSFGQVNVVDKDTVVNIIQFNQHRESELYPGSAFVLAGKVIEKTAFNNTKNALAGYIPGLYVSQGGGEPGAEWSTMFIRGKRTTSNGSNDPLILVDGFERDINYMDPNEIESITVLKDASATAIYGLKGASGVIEVKTKRGREGKTNVVFDSQLTSKTALNLPVSVPAADYMTYYNMARVNDGYAADFYAPDLIDKYRNNTDKYLYPDVNWLGMFFNENSYKQRYSISIDGGSKIAKYYVLFSYIGDDGNFVTAPSINKYSTQNKWEKYSIRTNIDVQITDKLGLEAGVSSVFSFVNNPSNTTGSALYRTLLDYNPNVHPVLNANNSISGTQMYTNNPYKVLNYSGYSESFNRYVTATIRLKYDLNSIAKGLTMFGAFAFDNNYTHVSRRLKESAVYELQIDPGSGLPKEDDNGYLYRQLGNNAPMVLSGNSGTYYRRMNYEFGLNYQKHWNKHQIFARAFGFNYDYQDDVKLPHARAGINAGANYVYDKRYAIDVTGSWSGTEQFPSENRMYLYPAVGLGWIVTNEQILKNNSTLSYLKLRGSYGIAGSDNITNNGSDLYYYHVLSLAKGGTAFFGEGNPTSITAGNFSTGYLEGIIANPVLRPESTTKKNIGFDAGFMNNRLTASFDYFDEYTNYILAVSKSMPGIMGVPSGKMMLENIGEVSNKGVELQLGWSDEIGEMTYFINMNATYARNRVEYLDEEPGLAEPQAGYPLDAYWGFKQDGFFKSNEEVAAWADQSSIGRATKGDLRFVNQNPNEDDLINEYDRVYLGTVNTPDWFYGVRLGGNLKGWELSLLFQGVQGMNKIYRDGINRPFSNSGNFYTHHVDNFWTDENAENPTYPRLTIEGSSSTKAKTDFWMKDASYFRLKNMEFAYTLPAKWLSPSSDIRVYVSGTNLLCWDQLNGIADPDITADGKSYPVNRMFTAGLRIRM